MMKKLLIVPDSFKGTMSSLEICSIWREAIRARAPRCETVAIPVADGGEGTLDCFQAAVGGRMVQKEIHGPFGESVRGRYLILPDGNTAVVELAVAAGLPLAEGRENPLTASTFGVGELMGDAASHGCRRLIMGLGGSCTNDAGAGIAAALGARFFDAGGHAFVPAGGTLGHVRRIDLTALRSTLAGCTITAMCDVESPLYGEQGAAFVYGPQKGADPSMAEELDHNLRLFARAIHDSLGLDVSALPGGGAAGGAGAGVFAFLSGKLRHGIDVVLDTVRFSEHLRGADFVITGEGRIDGQSLRGKVVSGVARRAVESGVPVIAVVGDIAPDAAQAYAQGVSAIFSINRRAVPFTEARKTCREDLAFTADTLLRLLLAAGR